MVFRCTTANGLMGSWTVRANMSGTATLEIMKSGSYYVYVIDTTANGQNLRNTVKTVKSSW